jgi:hypothetical protein
MVPEGLNPHIWLQVQFIPDGELDHLFCVNNMFFNVVLNGMFTFQTRSKKKTGVQPI